MRISRRQALIGLPLLLVAGFILLLTVPKGSVHGLRIITPHPRLPWTLFQGSGFSHRKDGSYDVDTYALNRVYWEVWTKVDNPDLRYIDGGQHLRRGKR